MHISFILLPKTCIMKNMENLNIIDTTLIQVRNEIKMISKGFIYCVVNGVQYIYYTV